MFQPERLIRPNIAALVPYSSARSEYCGTAEIYLDANENSHGSAAGNGFNRYPDPVQKQLRKRVATLFNVPEESVFLGNGSDEAIDLLFRIFCRPGIDEVIICPPTYGMYETAAAINDAVLRRVPLTAEFQLDVGGMLNTINESTRLIFLCSPNNPTGNLLRRSDIMAICNAADCIVVVDEAYIEFADCPSLLSEIPKTPNLVVLRTLSKAFGCAGVRIGMAFANHKIISVMNTVKPPYNIGTPAAQLANAALSRLENVESWIKEIISERSRLAFALGTRRSVECVFPSDANFLLTRFREAGRMYDFLISRGIVVRDRSRLPLCEQCLRITVGTAAENQTLLDAIDEFEGL